MNYSNAALKPEKRLGRTAGFLGLEERDLQLVRQTSGLVKADAGRIVDELYDHLVSFPESADLLGRASDATGEGVGHRRETLKAWLANVLGLVSEASEVLPAALHSTGSVHAGAGKSGIQIPLDLMVLTTARLQNAINAVLLDTREAEPEAVLAWGKLLWLVLDMMASAYDSEPANGQALPA